MDRLAQTLHIFGDHGASCETATQFYRHYIIPRIQRFREQLKLIKPNGHGLRVVLRDMRKADRLTGMFVDSRGYYHKTPSSVKTQTVKQEDELPCTEDNQKEDELPCTEDSQREDELPCTEDNQREDELPCREDIQKEDVEMKDESNSQSDVNESCMEQKEDYSHLKLIEDLDDEACVCYDHYFYYYFLIVGIYF